MSLTDETSATSAFWGRGVAVWAVVALVFTVLMVQQSMRDGRLRAGPVYDDVVYFTDALARLQVLDEAGIVGFARNLMDGPPHSPWSSGVALGSYLLLGRFDWAPYVGNCVVILALLLLVRHLMTDRPGWARAGAALLVLGVPVTSLAVTEFRPDAAAGLATAAGVLLMMEDAGGTGTRRSRIVLGVVWGLALLIKPSVLPLTVAMMLASLLIRALVVRYGGGRSWREAGDWRVWLGVPAVALAVALPHYAVAWRHVRDYIWSVILGQQQAVWQTQGAWGDHALYFLTGCGGASQLGHHLWLLGVMLGAGVWLAVMRGSRLERWRWGGLLALAAVAYALPTLNRTKNPFLALSFHWMVLLMAVVALRAWWSGGKGEGDRRWLRMGAGWAAVGLALVLAQPRWPRASYGATVVGSDDAAVRTVARAQDAVFAAILPRVTDRETYIYFTAPGYVDGAHIRYRLLREGRDARVLVSLFDTDFETIRTEMERADMVVAAEHDSGVTDGGMPAAQFQDRAVEAAEAMEGLYRVARVPVFEGRYVHVFARPRAFEGFEHARGLGVEEGPYPQWGILTAVRWGLGPATEVSVKAKEAGTWDMAMRAWANLPGQTMTVVLNGEVVETLAVPHASSYAPASLALRLPMRAGENRLELRYARHAEDGDKPMAVLFERLSVCPAAGAGE